MGLLLEITDGELKGMRTPVRAGLSIGRKKGLLTIQDPKISSQHAEVQARPDGTFWLVDLGSQNGIKLGQTRVRELLLEAGVSFHLGRTPFQVIDEEAALLGSSETLQSGKPEAPVKVTPLETIIELAGRAARESERSPREITAIDPVLRLKFVRGIQTGTEWTVGYGPRIVGSSSLDLHLEDPQLPAVCFRLIPQKSPQGSDTQVLFQNESDVHLNGRWVEKDVLKDGDLLEIKGTQIQVRFGEGLDKGG